MAGNGAEALVIEIVGDAAGPHFRQGTLGLVQVRLAAVAQNEAKTIGLNVLGRKRLRDLTQVGYLKPLVGEFPPRPAENREMLAGVRVPVLQAAHREPAWL